MGAPLGSFRQKEGLEMVRVSGNLCQYGVSVVIRLKTDNAQGRCWTVLTGDEFERPCVLTAKNPRSHAARQDAGVS